MIRISFPDSLPAILTSSERTKSCTSAISEWDGVLPVPMDQIGLVGDYGAARCCAVRNTPGNLFLHNLECPTGSAH